MKSRLRTRMRALRADLAPAHRQRAAFAAASAFIRNRKLAGARRIALYLAVGSELDPAPLMSALLRAGRTCYVPGLCCQQPMRLVRVRAHTPLRRGRHGIPQPAATAPRALLRGLDLILLPLLAFDDEGRRLGAGGGYYDRLIGGRRALRRPLLVGYAYAAQRLPELPEDDWDQRLDAVVTERGIIWFT